LKARQRASRAGAYAGETVYASLFGYAESSQRTRTNLKKKERFFKLINYIGNEADREGGNALQRPRPPGGCYVLAAELATTVTSFISASAAANEQKQDDDDPPTVVIAKHGFTPFN